MPDYVFFETAQSLELRRLRQAGDRFRLLVYDDGDWRLRGQHRPGQSAGARGQVSIGFQDKAVAMRLGFELTDRME